MNRQTTIDQPTLGTKLAYRFSVHFLLIVVLLSILRIHFLVKNGNSLSQDHSISVVNYLHLFISSMRFDVQVASFTLIPLILAIVLGIGVFKSSRQIEVGFSSLFSVYLAICLVFLFILSLIDIYFFAYFNSHINNFFWEFLFDRDNANLAADGIFDVARPSILALEGVFLVAYVIFSVRLIKETSKIGRRFYRVFTNFFSNKVSKFVLFIGLLICTRGTFDPRPLAKQTYRINISSNAVINAAHNNALYPLILSIGEYKEYSSQHTVKMTTEEIQTHIQRVQQLLPDHQPVEIRKDVPAFSLSVRPEESSGFFLKKPKHIILMYMESNSFWPLTKTSEGFDQVVAGNLAKVRSEGLSFERHFASGTGTLTSISGTAFNTDLGPEFSKPLPYFSQVYRPLPNRLAVKLNEIGWKTSFFYAGVSMWHRIDAVSKLAGFESFFAENSFPDFPHHRHGIYDEDLNNAVLDQISKSDEPTFSFVMTLANHPPYNIPESEMSEPISIPPSLNSRMSVREQSVLERYKSWRYADRSLGRMLERLKKMKEYDETLVIVTGDHSCSGYINWNSSESWQVERIPLVFWGPLLKETNRGKKIELMTTHLDLFPSIVSLATKEQTELITWGRNIWNLSSLSKDTAMGNSMSCYNGACISRHKRGQISEAISDSISFSPDTNSQKQGLLDQYRSSYYTLMRNLFLN